MHTSIVQPNLVSLDQLWCKLRQAESIRLGRVEQQLIESHVLVLVKNGQGTLTIDLQEYRLRQDAVHIALPGQTIGITSEAEDALDVYLLSFDVAWDGEPAEPFLLRGEIPLYPEPQLLRIGEFIHTAAVSEQPIERFRGQAAFQELFYWIMKSIRLLPETDSRAALERTRTYIDAHYNESLSIDQLARMAEISPKYYVDLFKKTYGKSTIDYVTEVRMRHAKQLMVQSNALLRDIAFKVGYRDEFYFSRKFKSEVGVSPTVYMKNRRRKIVAYGSTMLGHLLALSVIPYAAPLHPKWTAYYHQKYRADIPIHLSAYRTNQDWKVNLETLQQSQPDLILCSSEHLHPDERSMLEKIAPVRFIPCEKTSWREQLQRIASELDLMNEATVWLDSYEHKVAQARERILRDVGDEAILPVSYFKQRFYLYPTRGMEDVLFADLRLKRLPIPIAAGQGLSAEQFADMDADRILLNICQEPESLRHWQTLQTSVMWQDLKAVRQNRVHLINSDPWRQYSAHAIDRMVDDFKHILYGDRPE